MAFETRCPECKAKLRLDEAPAPGVPVECPRCGSQFDPPEADAPPPRPKKKKTGGEKKAAGGAAGVGRKKAKKKKTNPLVLLLSVGFGFVAMITVFALLYIFVFNRSGSVEEMLIYVPGECNWARGVNTGQLAGYPGYADQVAKFNTADVKAATDELAKAAGQNPDTFLTYLVIAKNRSASGTGTIYVLRAKKAFKPADVGAALAGSSQTSLNGETAYRAGTAAPGILSGAVVYMPTSRLVVVVPPGGPQNQLANGSAAGKSNKKDSFAGQLDDTGRLGIRGSIWLIVRSTGGMKDYINTSVAGVAKDFPKLADRAAAAKTMAIWTTPGGNGSRLGVGIDCGTSKDAAELAKSFRDGPLGKGDESEPTNDMKKEVRFATDKKQFSQFMQNASFDNVGACGVIRSKAEADNAKTMMDIFNNPQIGDAGG